MFAHTNIMAYRGSRKNDDVYVYLFSLCLKNKDKLKVAYDFFVK